jgi:uncharacterized protein (DUF2062 family)
LTDTTRKHEHRLRRQVSALTRKAPGSERYVEPMLQGKLWMLRLPVALFLIAGSFLAILPFFGLWMLPLGLLLLAVDLPVLRPTVSAAIIRVRRRLGRWTRHRSQR